MGNGGEFKPGHAKLGGRVKGTPNKRSRSLSELLDSLDFDPILEIVKRLPNLSDKEFIQVSALFLPYLYPKLKVVEHSIENTTDSNEDLIHAARAKELVEIIRFELRQEEKNDADLPPEIAQLIAQKSRC